MLVPVEAPDRNQRGERRVGMQRPVRAQERNDLVLAVSERDIRKAAVEVVVTVVIFDPRDGHQLGRTRPVGPGVPDDALGSGRDYPDQLAVVADLFHRGYGAH